MRIISKIYVIKDHRVFDHTVISYKYITEQNRVLHGSVDDTSAGYQTVLHSCTRIVLSRRYICDLGLDRRLLFEEIVPDFRFQEIHVCLIISLCSRDIIPVVIDLISVNPLQIFVTDKNIIYKIMPSFLGSTLDQFDQLPSSDDIDTSRYCIIGGNDRFLFKFLDPTVLIHAENTKSFNLALILACSTYNGNICPLCDMILQDFIVIQLLDSITGSDHHIGFMTVL